MSAAPGGAPLEKSLRRPPARIGAHRSLPAMRLQPPAGSAAGGRQWSGSVWRGVAGGAVAQPGWRAPEYAGVAAWHVPAARCGGAPTGH